MKARQKKWFGIALVVSLGLNAHAQHIHDSSRVRSQKPIVFHLAGCAPEDFVEILAPEVTVELGGQRGYTPHCLRVKKGTKVTVMAVDFHPLQAMSDMRGVANPFLNPDDIWRSPVTRRLEKAGTYGYYCPLHGDAFGGGMAGLIEVID